MRLWIDLLHVYRVFDFGFLCRDLVDMFGLVS